MMFDIPLYYALVGYISVALSHAPGDDVAGSKRAN